MNFSLLHVPEIAIFLPSLISRYVYLFAFHLFVIPATDGHQMETTPPNNAAVAATSSCRYKRFGFLLIAAAEYNDTTEILHIGEITLKTQVDVYCE